MQVSQRLTIGLLEVWVQFDPHNCTPVDKLTSCQWCNVAQVPVQFHNGHGLGSIDDLVQASLGSGDVSNALSLWGCELEVACANMHMVPLLIQCCYQYKGAAYGGSVQNSVIGMVRFSSEPWFKPEPC